jgi:hypothetical protein
MRAAFAGMHRDLIATMGDPATYVPAAGGSVPLLAVLDRNTAELGEYGQTVAYRPSVSVLCADVARPEQGDLVNFTDPDTGAVVSSWQVIRPASADDMVVQLWVAPA